MVISNKIHASETLHNNVNIPRPKNLYKFNMYYGRAWIDSDHFLVVSRRQQKMKVKKTENKKMEYREVKQ